MEFHRGNNVTKCSRCGREMPQSDLMFATCSQCREQSRAHMKEVRSVQKVERAEDKERQLETEIKKGNLNAGMKPFKKKFLSWEDYKITFETKGKTVDYQQYLTDKTQFLESQERESPLDELGRMVYETPLRSEHCKVFREMLLNMTEKDILFCAQHHVNCSACMAWYGTVYKPQFIGVDLFNSGI